MNYSGNTICWYVLDCGQAVICVFSLELKISENYVIRSFEMQFLFFYFTKECVCLLSFVNVTVFVYMLNSNHAKYSCIVGIRSIDTKATHLLGRQADIQAPRFMPSDV